MTNYPTMTIGEIAMLRVADHADQDAHLWLWTTNAFMEEAHRVAMKPVSVVPLRGGRMRVGCAFVT